jgi:hypothetical protein
MRKPDLPVMDLIQQFNNRITDDGDDTGDNDTNDDPREIPGQECDHADNKDDEKELVFHVQVGHG